MLNLPARFPLAFLPTPIHELKNLSRVLSGPRILIKRDDQTGLAFGGNKTRKLEFVVADALSKGADTLLTTGGVQSNHCRQTAAAACRAGLRCELLLGGNPPEQLQGNFFLDHLFKARLHWQSASATEQELNQLADQLRSESCKPYVIPIGASNALGSLGYVHAMQELKEQMREQHLNIDHIVFASCSGGTQAGMVLGAKLINFQGKILGIDIAPVGQFGNVYEAHLAKLANEAAKMIGMNDAFLAEDFFVNYDYLGQGYAIVGDLEREAIHLLAEKEGILLDPVYTGRAFGGLLDLIRSKHFSKNETILFWHTGGTPALFAQVENIDIKNNLGDI